MSSRPSPNPFQLPQTLTKPIKKLGILSSGGDAPGMNAAIRAATRVAIHHGVEPVGIIGGYPGLIAGEFVPLSLGSMANVIQRGGTLLKTGRSAEFYRPEGRALAVQKIGQAQIDALVVIGGDGSFAGAHLLQSEHGVRCVGVPGTIDNDIYGTDLTIGFDTAVNIALDAIDRIRDTAASHDRLFIVEVMGRDSGFIAVEVGLAGGAEEIFFPENPVTIEQAIATIKRGIERGKKSSILVAAEGQKPGRAYDLAEAIRKKSGFEAKVCVLGHIQRGGAPTAVDRNLASRLAAAAVEALLAGHSGLMVGLRAGQLAHTGFAELTTHRKSIPHDLLRLARTLAT